MALAAPGLFGILAIGCAGGRTTGRDLVIAVNAPFSAAPQVAQSMKRGVGLAVDQVNAAGGVKVGGAVLRLAETDYDNGLSPGVALGNVGKAADGGALAVIDEGTGLDASWQVANRTALPIGLVYQGGEGLVDSKGRPNVFRIAPTDRGVAFRLAEYLIPKGLRIAILHDDSDYGQRGDSSLRAAFGGNPASITADISVAAPPSDIGPQVLQARRSGANALLVWARPPGVAQAIRSSRAADWAVPVFTPPSGEDPAVRQQLSDHPDWVDSLTFAAGRLTAEKGPDPFLQFQAAYEKAFGPEAVGVTSQGRKVNQPPEYPMYAYDFVKVLVAAVQGAGGPERKGVLAALNQVSTQGANGDSRGFNQNNHEGVVDDDVYFARFRNMIFEPVKDDSLSATLPTLKQTG